jgi:hypothetical protein
MPANHPVFVMAYDTALGRYTESREPMCMTRWQSSGLGHAAGQLCGHAVVKTIGDTELCQHHYNRAAEWQHAELRRQSADDDADGWHVETRRWDAVASEITYYVRRSSDGLIKIGTTVAFRTRLGDLRAEHGELQVLATHVGDRSCEQSMHARFRKLRVEGEWFRPGRPLWAWILEVRGHQEYLPADSLFRGTLPYAEVARLSRLRPRPVRQAS